jgi:pyruvate/2-oxoglutarate dehydrogenase complex dihydrolipoamide acyltransferase (E2) component
MSSSPTDATTIVDVPMPHMGTSIAEGTVIGWHKAVGEAVAVDEVLCDITTDKIDTECPSPAAGVLVEILVTEGETVDVGTVLARIAVEGGAPAPSTDDPPPADARTTPAAASGNNGRAVESTGEARRRYSPVVTRLAADRDVDLAEVAGTGRGGRVTKKDVLAFLEARETAEPPLHSESPYRPDPPTAPEPPAASRGQAAAGTSAAGRVAPPDVASLGGEAVPLSRMRQSIAAAMKRSQDTAATAHTVVECDMSHVERRRRELGVTALPLVARATIDVLREFPDLNATIADNTLTRYDRVHLGVAVSLGEDGLIVPVIQEAQDLGEEGLARRIKDLATRARSRELLPDEVQGATFTLTSPGAAGALIATPIINVPQVGILDMEAIVRRPVVVTDDSGLESIAIRSMAYFVLGWDHRAIDGMYAAHFLTALRHRLETP